MAFRNCNFVSFLMLYFRSFIIKYFSTNIANLPPKRQVFHGFHIIKAVFALHVRGEMIVHVLFSVFSTFFAENLKSTILDDPETIISSVSFYLFVVKQDVLLNFNVFYFVEIVRMVKS